MTLKTLAKWVSEDGLVLARCSCHYESSWRVIAEMPSAALDMFPHGLDLVGVRVDWVEAHLFEQPALALS